MNGDSQAVRIPREFRLDANRVEITRNDEDDLVLHPMPADRGSASLEVLSGLDGESTSLLR